VVDRGFRPVGLYMCSHDVAACAALELDVKIQDDASLSADDQQHEVESRRGLIGVVKAMPA
jgi:hypothetical protein